MGYYDELTNEEKGKIIPVDIPLSEYLLRRIKQQRIDGFREALSDWHLKIKDTVFTEFIHFEGEFEYNITFENCYFLREVSFYKAIFSGFTISHCFFNEDIRIGSLVNFKDEFNIINLSTKKALYVMGGKYTKCRWSLANDSIIKIDGGEYDDLNIGYWGGAKFKSISLNLRKLKGHVNINGDQTQIQKLMLMNFAPDVSVIIEDVFVNQLSIHRFKNEKGFRLINVRGLSHLEPTEFSIYSSSLGKAEMYSLDFNSFAHFYIVDSQLTDCSFVNVKWKFDIKAFKGRDIGKTEQENLLFEKIMLIEQNNFKNNDIIEELKHEVEVKEYYSKLRENYRQLRYALSKQGDSINEQKFHSKEMLAYNKTLSIEENLGTKLIVKLSYWFSDFGQSIARPFLALIIGHWVLLIVLIYFNGIPNISISVFNGNIEGFKNGLNNYLKLINPLRKADDIVDCTIIIDIMMRIWASYMLYNIIRATRRFIK